MLPPGEWHPGIVAAGWRRKEVEGPRCTGFRMRLNIGAVRPGIVPAEVPVAVLA